MKVYVLTQYPTMFSSEGSSIEGVYKEKKAAEEAARKVKDKYTTIDSYRLK